MQEFLTNIALPGGYYMVIITFLLMIVAMVIGIFSDRQGAIKFVGGLAVMAILYFIFYSGANGVNPSTIQVSTDVAKMVEAGIATLGVMLGATFVLMLGSLLWDAIQ
jgi:hypothetical protein